MTLHLIYAGVPDSARIQAPSSITTNLYKFLSERTEVKYYRLDSIEIPEIAPEDVVLGHPIYDKNTIIQQIFRRNIKCKARCLIHPFHSRIVDDNFPFDFIARQADIIFGICGPYWYDTIESTPFAHWKHKMVRLDMAIDKITFPFLRQEVGPLAFKPPGLRKLVYIGNSTPNKNLDYMIQILTKMPEVKLHWYGGSKNHALGRLRNVSVIGWQTMNTQVAEKLVSDYDIMISTSISDANPTTLLEARAWGLITACTKESGYYNDKFFTELYLDDLNKTIAAIRGLLTTPSHELYQRAVASRAEVESKYTWANFGDTVWKHLSPYLQ